MSPSITILMPYFGKWPVWFELTLHTLSWNSKIKWLFFSDCENPGSFPPNAELVRISFNDLKLLFEKKLGRSIALTNPYKLCDLRPAFGYLFEDYISDVDFWGYGDCDVIFGDILSGIASQAFEYDLISLHDEGMVSGYFALYRNSKEINKLFINIPNWEEILSNPEYLRTDEISIADLIPPDRKYFKEVFGSPCPWVSWKDKTFNFPTEWYWDNGKVTNSFCDGEYPFFHFFHWKYGWHHWRESKKLVHFNTMNWNAPFKINQYGFFPRIHKNAPVVKRLIGWIKDLFYAVSSVGASYHLVGFRLFKGKKCVGVFTVLRDIYIRIQRIWM